MTGYSFKMNARVFKDSVLVETEFDAQNMTTEIINMRAKMTDEAVRQWLINEGWTPPPKQQELL